MIEKLQESILFCLFVIVGSPLVGCGGGGGGNSTPPISNPPSSQTAPFTISGDISQLNGAPGATSTMNVTVAPQGAGDTNFQVNLGFNGSDGITGTFTPTSVPGSGGTSTFAMTVDPGVVPLFIAPSMSIVGTRSTDNHTEAINIPSLFVPIGGGTMTFTVTNLPSGTPPSATTYIQNLLSLITSKAGIYDLCGKAATSQMVEIRFDPTPHVFFFDGGYDPATHRMHPVIHFGFLPNPGADGTDPNFDHPLAHEVSNALRGGLFSAKVRDGVFNVRDRAELDPWAENCTADVLKFMNASGRLSANVNEDFDPVLFFDPFTTYFTMNELAGNSEVPGYDIGFQYAGSGAYFLLVGPSGFKSIGDYQNKYFASLNQLGRLFTPAELQAFHNANASIDGMMAGDFLAAKFPLIYSAPAPVTGPILIPVAYRPQFPEVTTVVAMQRDQSPSTVETATDVTSGPLKIAATSASGAPFGTLTTDLANTGFSNPITLNFGSSVPNGNYNFSATWFAADGTTVIKTKSMALANVPFADAGSLMATAFGPPLGFVIAVHRADNSAANFVFHANDVTEGTITYTAPGVLVAQPGGSGEITVKGHKYTIPLVPGSTTLGYGRLIYLPID
jgi:hypothetical protein